MYPLQFIVFILAPALVFCAENDVSDDDTLENPTSITMNVVHEVNLNRAFDNALPRIRKSITRNGMDPMEAPDVEIPLSHFPGLLNTRMIMHQGHIQQLSTVMRTGDIVLQYSTKKLSLYLNIGWENLDVSHAYTLRYMLFSRKGDCYSRYENVKARILVDYDLKKKKIDLKFVKFVDVGRFEIKLEGHLIDGFVNLITKAVTKVFRTTVLQMIASKAYEVIDKRVQEINDLIPSPMDFSVIPEVANDDYAFLGSYEVDDGQK